MKILRQTLTVGLSVLSISVLFADTEQEDAALIQIVKHIEHVFPLIDAAKAQQNLHQRVLFHYDTYTDRQGNTKNGLRQDLQLIRDAILERLHHNPTEPRAIQAIEGDYLQPTYVLFDDNIENY